MEEALNRGEAGKGWVTKDEDEGDDKFAEDRLAEDRAVNGKGKGIQIKGTEGPTQS